MATRGDSLGRRAEDLTADRPVDRDRIAPAGRTAIDARDVAGRAVEIADRSVETLIGPALAGMHDGDARAARLAAVAVGSAVGATDGIPDVGTDAEVGSRQTHADTGPTVRIALEAGPQGTQLATDLIVGAVRVGAAAGRRVALAGRAAIGTDPVAELAEDVARQRSTLRLAHAFSTLR